MIRICLVLDMDLNPIEQASNVKPLDALPVMLFRVGGYSQSTTKSRQSAIGPN